MGMVCFGLMGGVITPVAITAYTIAASMISAPECSLIQLLEMVVAPVWTWLLLGEVPELHSVLAGIGLVVVLAAHSVYTGRLKKEVEYEPKETRTRLRFLKICFPLETDALL